MIPLRIVKGLIFIYSSSKISNSLLEIENIAFDPLVRCSAQVQSFPEFLKSFISFNFKACSKLYDAYFILHRKGYILSVQIGALS